MTWGYLFTGDCDAGASCITLQFMLIRQLARHAAFGQAMRIYIRRRGFTSQGYPVWSTKEDAAMRSLYPRHRGDKAFLEHALPRRTYAAIKERARTLGIAKNHHLWTNSEISKLRKLYPRLSRDELLEAFTYMRTWQAIKRKAKALHVGRPINLKIFQRPALDSIRSRARSLGMTMKDLDYLADTRPYFLNSFRWDPKLSNGAILKAVELLGGQIKIRWP